MNTCSDKCDYTGVFGENLGASSIHWKFNQSVATRSQHLRAMKSICFYIILNLVNYNFNTSPIMGSDCW